MRIKNNLKDIEPIFIGDEFCPVIFTHVGCSEDIENIEINIKDAKEKIQLAIQAGTNAICDVSINKKIPYIQVCLMKDLTIPFGAVSIYETYISLESNSEKINEQYFIKIIEEECLRGIDVLTLHATVLLEDDVLIKKSKRLIPSTSRGGVLMLELMKKYNIENPYYTCFEEILSIVKKYDVAISLGPMYRPASVCDCKIEDLHYIELLRMQKLCRIALDNGVNIMIEGIGHAPINRIEEMIKTAKSLCYNVPYRCMVVSTDISIGYDHVSSAIASALAIYYGADSITCVTRKEHLGIPSQEDTYEGVMVAKVAVHSGYSARTNDFTLDRAMTISRKKQGCIGNPSYALFPKLIEKYVQDERKCSMCGSYCPLVKQKEEKDGIL